jgi:DHA1 family inner membrane transport protein
MPSVAGVQVALMLTLALLTATLPSAVPAAATLILWGVLAFAVATPLQMRVVDTAPEAPNLVATLNQGAFNLGNASGAWLGGLALGAGVTYRALPWLGVGLTGATLALTALSMVLDRAAATAPGAQRVTA